MYLMACTTDASLGEVRQVGTDNLPVREGKIKRVYNGDGKSLVEFDIDKKFAALNKLITRDLNKNTSTPAFAKYTKEDISTYISNPYTYEKQLRQAVNYIYGASSHFRRLIQYFAGLNDLSFVISPYNIDPKKSNVTTVGRNYIKVRNMLSAMNIKTQFPKILTVCLREDTYYGTIWMGNDNITIQQLPSDFCSISTIEGNVPNVTFDFSYFDSRKNMLPYFPPEFEKKYNIYQKNRQNKWIELDSPTSFAIKCTSDILDYSIPPFAGILREVYEVEDYKKIRLSRTALDNYAMIVMSLEMDSDGNYKLDYDKAKDFWRNLDGVLPPEIGSILTPMPVDKISFEKAHTANTDTVADAEQNLFSAAGVSSLLFNNSKASANALLLSIKTDQAITFGIVKSIEDMVNRLIQSQPFGKNFKVTFLDVSPYNRKEMGDMYLKAATYGMPTISLYCASQGLGQAEIDSMSYLESDVMKLQDIFRPLANSAQMAAPTDGDKKNGRPEKDASELSDSGEQTREDGDDWG